jgi:hypothetical protein
MTSTQVAQKLHRASRIENGAPRDAWALAQRLAAYLESCTVVFNEELAFSLGGDGRVGVARFRLSPRGKTKDFAMISLDASRLSRTLSTRLTDFAQRNLVVTGSMRP